jgi:aryl-alcohol dehydrogenase-like predicted oxidoreductase
MSVALRRAPHSLSQEVDTNDPNPFLLSRRRALRLASSLGMAAALRPLVGIAATDVVGGFSPIITRPIPRTGERLPVVGLGTSGVFNVGDYQPQRTALVEVLRTLASGGGKVIDTASSYGTAESVAGSLLAETGLRPRIFIATKLESNELTDADVQGSLKRLRTSKIDLMQLHNASDPDQSLEPLRKWKERGLCRYIGITCTSHVDYAAVEAVLRREKPDFLQIDYSLDDREAERRLIPLCIGLRTAILTAVPLGHGELFRQVRGRPLPQWASEFDATSWAQFFLKFVLGNEAVTAAIPATNNPRHMADNLGAGRGRMPNAAQRRRMVQFIESVG